jgi:hypothetical protein
MKLGDLPEKIPFTHKKNNVCYEPDPLRAGEGSVEVFRGDFGIIQVVTLMWAFERSSTISVDTEQFFRRPS